jgi:hypothetical protein
LGWLTNSRLVVAEESVTLTLDAFEKNGDSIIIANNWDEKLGAYQEYFIVVYYTNDGLNGDGYGYFDEEGIVVYHVNASLCAQSVGEQVYYRIYNNNTDVSDTSYGTENNLIELLTAGRNDYVFGVGASLSGDTALDNGDKIAYTFTVNALTDDTATITFTKNN